VKPLVIEEEAEPELAASVAFYEQRQSRLGLDFERAAREALKKIARSPDRWPLGKHGTRHYLMNRFPFYSLPRYAGQNLDRCVCAHQPKTKLLENKDSVGAVKQEISIVQLNAPNDEQNI
jgi:hypothetical protein